MGHVAEAQSQPRTRSLSPGEEGVGRRSTGVRNLGVNSGRGVTVLRAGATCSAPLGPAACSLQPEDASCSCHGFLLDPPPRPGLYCPHLLGAFDLGTCTPPGSVARREPCCPARGRKRGSRPSRGRFGTDGHLLPAPLRGHKRTTRKTGQPHGRVQGRTAFIQMSLTCKKLHMVQLHI